MSATKEVCKEERSGHCGGGFGSLSWPVLLLLAGALAPSSAADRSQLPPTCDRYNGFTYRLKRHRVLGTAWGSGGNGNGIEYLEQLGVGHFAWLIYNSGGTIYCYGPLLDTIQMAAIYPDSKTFVDMKLKLSPNRTLAIFHEMMNKTESRPTKADIEEFVADNFDPEGSEFENWTPDDWKKDPAFLQRIKDPEFRKWASGLNELWLNLGRKMKPEVKENQDLYSIIYVDHPVIVPGGRFREFYYWDSYWIIRGLLLSEMHSTARGMLSNYIDIVERMGHIPNGGRIYYSMRSQPPLLTPMMKLYLNSTHDIEYLRQHIHTLEREFDFWISSHTIDVDHNGVKYKLARYVDKSQGPRPESYREDVESARMFESNDMKEEYYAELKAAAESGWDFSTRWFILNGTNKGNLTNLKTRSIIPVDLNAILCGNAELLAEFHGQLHNRDKQVYYRDIADNMKIAIEKVLWHEEVGSWLDWDLDAGRRRDYFYPSNVAPLWTNSYDRSRSQYFVSRVIKYLDNTKVDNYAGGIPTTFEHSGEQWDYPNAWPPLQHMVVVGLANTRLPAAMRLAREWAAKWVRSNFAAWKENEVMYEKYDATRVGGYGGGGEYEVQAGFGWTNGIIMDLLDFYGGMLSAVDAFESELIEDADSGVPGSVVLGAGVGMGAVFTALLVIAATLTAGALGFVVYKKRQEHLGGNYAAEGVRLLSQDKGYTELRNINGTSSNGKKR